jgi:hypothetical protein
MTDPTQAIVERALDQAAEPWMHGHIERAFWLWAYSNEAWFDGTLSIPFIEIARPRQADNRPGDAFADLGPGGDHGVRLAVRIHPELLRGWHADASRALDGYLLHEQVHAWQVEALGWPWDPDNDWHGRTFQSKLAEVERAYSLDLTISRRGTWR